MHNLWTVIWFEFVRTIKKKSFWIGTLAFPVLLSVIFGLSYFSGKSAERVEDDLEKEQFSVVVLDDSKLVLPEALTAVGAKLVETKQAGIGAVKAGEFDAFFYYPEKPSEQRVEVYAKDAGLTKNGKYGSAAASLLKGSVASGVDSEEKVAVLQSGVRSDVTTYVDGEESPGLERAFVPGAFLVLFYAIIVLLGNQMLTSTTEEKENRVIEMILTSVRAKTLITGKIISLMMLGILQIAVICLPLVVAAVFFGDQLNLPSLDLSNLPVEPLPFLIGLLLFVASFMLFTGLLVAIGASVPTAKEANGFFGVAIGGMFLPLYGVLAVISSPDQLFVKILSFFPLTAPVTLMLRNAAGNLSNLEAAIGIALLTVCGVIILIVATRAFKYGSLEYERKLSLKELFRA